METEPRELDLMEDKQLAAACREGKATAQKTLYDRFSKRMMGVCLRYAEDSMEAMDVMQEGFIKVFRNIDSYSGEGSLEGWVRKIVVNTALDNYRKNKNRRHALDLDEVSNMIPVNESITDRMSADHLLEMVQSLPEGYRVIFNLYAIEGYTHKEIGEQLGISANTSKSQYSRARAYMQRLIEQNENKELSEGR